jgi:MFS family permease
LTRAPSAIGAMVGGALLLVVLSTLYTWLPTFLQRTYGMAPVRAGVLGSVVVLAGAVGTAGGAVLADWAARRDVRRRLVVPAAAGVASSALLGTAFLAVPVGSAQLLLILAGGATVTAAVGPAAAAVLDVVQPGLRATAISVFVLVQNLFGLAIGPVLAGAIAERWGLTSALGAVAGLGVPAALALYSGSRSYGRDRNQAASLPAPRVPDGAAPRSGATELGRQGG